MQMITSFGCNPAAAAAEPCGDRGHRRVCRTGGAEDGSEKWRQPIVMCVKSCDQDCAGWKFLTLLLIARGLRSWQM